MGFFNILETFFFISLAITFVLIMMLVYHFKGRISLLEQKCDTMFEIMNNVVKEMRTIKMSSTSYVNPAMIVPNNETIMFQQRHNLGELFQQFQQSQFDEEDDEEDEDEDDEEEPRKIVVSDTEYEDDEQPVKIINIEFNEDASNESIDHLEALEEENISLHDEEVEEMEEVEELDSEDVSLEQSVDYKKMDISYLRTMVITRGLATDTKKMKKSDLIKLLEDSKE